MLITLCSLFAEEMVLSWSHPDSEVSFYRWRKGEDEWTLTKDNEILTTYIVGSTDEYHIQASYDGLNWSADHTVVFTSSKEIETVWSWIYGDDQVSYYRWRLDGGEWNIIDSSQKQVRTTLITNGRHIFEVCGSYDGMNWSEPASVLLTAVCVSPPVITTTNPIHLEAAASFSLSYGLYDFYNGHEIEGARYLMGTKPSFAADIEADLVIGRHFRIYADLSYARERKNETIIPDAFVVEHRQYGGGFDVLFPIKDELRPYIGININKSKDINAGYYSLSTFYGVRMGLDYFINESIYVGLSSGVKLAHNDDLDPLYRSYTFLMDPVGIKMGVKF